MAKAINADKIEQSASRFAQLIKRHAQAVDEMCEAEATPLNVRAYQILREALLSGAFAPGAFLSIRPLAEVLSMSPMPVREALAKLLSDGALEPLANRAFRVPIITSSIFREVLLMRLRLETAACEHAAILATPAEVARISALCEELVATSSSPPEIYLAVHRRFHFTIYEAARMPILKEVIEGLWLRIAPLMHSSSSETDLSADNQYHSALAKAIQMKDSTMAAAALQNDLVHASDPVLAYLTNMRP